MKQLLCQQKWVYSGITENRNLGKLWQNRWQLQQIKKKTCILREEGGFERGCFEQEFTGAKHELRVVKVSPWLSCRGGCFRTGDAVYIFPCWGPQ